MLRRILVCGLILHRPGNIHICCYSIDAMTKSNSKNVDFELCLEECLHFPPFYLYGTIQKAKNFLGGVMNKVQSKG